MSWVTGIKQVTTFQPERDGKQAIPKPVRVVSSLLPHAIERTLQRQTLLPESTGAGPCGTHARRVSSVEVVVDEQLAAMSPLGAQHYAEAERWALGSPVLAWSLLYLVEPLQAWYEKQNRPRDPLSRSGVPHGARSGGGNGRVTLW